MQVKTIEINTYGFVCVIVRMKKVRHWVQETIESGRFVEIGAIKHTQ
jgi:hypothetical protein